MNAYIVSNKHISVILSAYFKVANLPFKISDAIITDLGQFLLDANYASVNFYYRENHSGVFEIDTKAFAETKEPIEVIKVISLIDCLAYQSCKRSDWDDSDAKKYLDGLKVTFEKLAPINYATSRAFLNCAWDI